MLPQFSLNPSGNFRVILLRTIKEKILSVLFLIAATIHPTGNKALMHIDHPQFGDEGPGQKKASIIFDSDMGPDYDDVGAITLLHAFADSGKINILATIASTNYEGVAGVFNVLNTYFNRPDLPIAVPKGKAVSLKDSQHWSDTLLQNYPHKITRNNEVPDAVDLYRELLSAQPDNSVTIVTVGFFTNLAGLLKSSPDKYSPLTGKALINKKVKALVSMAGAFPTGKEFNIHIDALSASYVFANWETPVLFSGFEIGKQIKTGIPLINNHQVHSSPVKDVFRISTAKSAEDSNGRMSWDQTAVLVAVNGYQPYYKIKKGNIKVKEDGSNEWLDKGNRQAYLIEQTPPKEMEGIINKLMMHQPVKN